MTGDDIKTAVAALAVIFTAISVFYTIRRNSSQDRAGSMSALMGGWSARVDDLVEANKACEESRLMMAGQIEAMKKSTEQKIADLEGEATRVRLESRRDATALYAENDRLRERVRELESRTPPGGARRPPAG